MKERKTGKIKKTLRREGKKRDKNGCPSRGKEVNSRKEMLKRKKNEERMK